MTVKVLAGCLVLGLVSVCSLAADASDEPLAVTQLRRKILTGRLAAEPASQLVHRLIDAEGPELREIYIAAALRRGETLPHIAGILRSGSPAAKRKMTKLIRYTGISGATPQLLTIIGSENEHALSRIGALYALGALGDIRNAPAVAAVLDAPSRGPTEKRVAIATLAALGYRPAVPAIRNFINDDSLLVRIFAVGGLLELGDNPDIMILLTAARNPDFVVRQAACGALGSSNDPRAVRVLTLAAAGDFSQLVRQEAELSLIRIEAAAMDSDRRDQFLYDLIDHPCLPVRRWAIRSLANERGPRGRDLLRSTLQYDHLEKDRIAAYLLILPQVGPDFRGGF